jgi:hypothetical protein
MVTLVVMGLTFLLTTVLHAFLIFWFVLRPIAEHMKEDGEVAAAAISKHVLLPVFGRKEQQAE